jgi:hypothetical protein
MNFEGVYEFLAVCLRMSHLVDRCLPSSAYLVLHYVLFEMLLPDHDFVQLLYPLFNIQVLLELVVGNAVALRFLRIEAIVCSKQS